MRMGNQNWWITTERCWCFRPTCSTPSIRQRRRESQHQLHYHVFFVHEAFSQAAVVSDGRACRPESRETADSGTAYLLSETM